MITKNKIIELLEETNAQNAWQFGKLFWKINQERCLEDAQRAICFACYTIMGEDLKIASYQPRELYRTIRRDIQGENALPSTNVIEQLFGGWKKFRIELFKYAVRQTQKDLLKPVRG